MSKTKTPFFGLGAHGSVGGSITAQKLPKGTLLRTKPLPTYRYTLPQAYQRWLYEDYAYRWRQQSDAVKAQHRTAGVPYHLTGFQYWMKYNLTHLPDLAGWWKLDDNLGATVTDSSRNANTGTIFGPSPATGLIDRALHFTLNDYVEITCPQLNFTSGDFSVIAFIYVESLATHRYLLIRGASAADGYWFMVWSDGALRSYTNQPAAVQNTNSAPGDIVINTWYAVGLSRSGADITLYKDGQDVTLAPGVHLDPATSARTAKIGIYDNKISQPMEGVIDNLIVYNRALDPAEHLRWALRRYPA